VIRKLAALLALAAAPLGASATPDGLAWDSVTKFVMNADPSSLQPGSFDTDYATAAAVQPDENVGAGMPSQVRQAMAQAQRAQQMMQNGIAERHYVAGLKERTDDVAAQTARIVDCAARTVTTLDLRRKTFRVISMNTPSVPASGGGAGRGPSGSDNGRIAVSITNTALGAREVAGQSTDGFRSDATVAETDASGESRTQNVDLIGYYTSYSTPTPACSSESGDAMGQVRAAMMAGYSALTRALSSTSVDSRVSIKQSGPPLPLGKLAMYYAATFGTEGHAVTLVTERANLRPISASDQVFSVPPGFTQQQ
jgi:hypothetical protein